MGGGRRGGLAQVFDDFAARRFDALAVGEPGLGEGGEQGGEAGAAVAVIGREVGAPEEGLAVGGGEDGQGPAAGAGGGLDESHVDAVDVGTLFAIHFDGNEVAVEGGGGV